MEIVVGFILILAMVALAGLLVLRRRQQQRRPDPWTTRLDVDPKPNVIAALVQKLTGLFGRGNRSQQPLAQERSPSQGDLGSLPQAGPGAVPVDDDPAAAPADDEEAIRLATAPASATDPDDDETPSLTDILDLGALIGGAGSNENGDPEAEAVTAGSTGENTESSESPIAAGSDLEGLGDLREMFKTERIADPQFKDLVDRVESIDAEALVREIQALTELIRASVEEYPEASTGLDGAGGEEEQANTFGLITASAEEAPES